MEDLKELRRLAEIVASHEPDFKDIHEYLEALRNMQGELSGTTVLALLSRLERAEARVKLLESGIVSELVVTSVHSASAIGTTVSGISEELLKMGYAGLSERLEQAEQAVQRVREMSAHRKEIRLDYVGLIDLDRALDGDTRG